MDFIVFKKAVQAQLKTMCAEGLFQTNTNKHQLKEVYINSFPVGSNPIFRKKTEHDCNCCTTFMGHLGGVVSINGDKISTIWDVQIGGDYQVVADAMRAFVLTREILHPYFAETAKIGTDFNYDTAQNDRWEHFFYKLPDNYVLRAKDIPIRIGNMRSNKDVLKRSILEIQDSSVDVVLELIAQGSLYRGAEHKKTVELLKKLKLEYSAIQSEPAKVKFLWDKSKQLGESSKIRNTVIGTLLTDLSEGTELEDAVRKFEAKVAPQNYKRPTAIVTKGMVQKAEAKVKELGLESALHRRFAVMTDIKANNILFADRSAKAVIGSPFAELATTQQKPNLDKIQEVQLKDFLDNILPTAEKVEIYFDNAHQNNLMTLIAPEDQASTGLFSWDNNFSWSYRGEFADSIKERVKNAGGSIEGFFRASLSWSNFDDMDLHAHCPGGEHIYFSCKKGHITQGQLDVDENGGCARTREAVENIIWKDERHMKEGNYTIHARNFNKRENTDVGYTLQVECQGTTWEFDSPQNITQDVCTFSYTKKDGMKLVSGIQSKQRSQDAWGISTSQFHPVQLIMKSPNHWDEKAHGNEHLFFIVDKCKNPDDARGFYNEFLNPALNADRKVFEVLGSKLKATHSDEQLSGLGFSSTLNGHVVLRVTGAFNRTIKVLF